MSVLFMLLPLLFPQWIVMKMSTSSTGGSSASTSLASRRGSSLRRPSSGSTRTLFRSALRTRPSDSFSTRCCRNVPTGTKNWDPEGGCPQLPPHFLSRPVVVKACMHFTSGVSVSQQLTSNKLGWIDLMTCDYKSLWFTMLRTTSWHDARVMF